MREMDQHFEDNYLLNKGSYRGRPGQRSIDPVILDITQVEIAMITRRILVRFNNNATAYFDKNMPRILCLCLRSYQIPAEFTGLLGDLLRYNNYAIKTANDVSDDTYSHSSESPVFGSGQSSIVSATGWGKLVLIALNMHKNKGMGHSIVIPREHLKQSLRCWDLSMTTIYQILEKSTSR